MERLQKSKSATRGWLTRASKALEDVAVKDNASEIELNSALTEFNTRLQNVDDAQAQLEDSADITDLDTLIDEAFAFRQMHIEVRNKAETALKALRDDKESVVSLHSVGSIPFVTPSTNPFSHARLPKLELPKFGGNHIEFTSFFDKFCAVVDGSDLPPVTKFTYLQSLLTGEALASIKGLSITDGSYTVAKEILTQRYGRKERIIFAHIQKLLSLQCDCQKLSDIWQLYDSLQSHVRCLETLGVSGDTYGVILTPMVLSRIPPEMRLEWAREGEGKESDLTFLLDFLYREIKRRERSQTFSMPREKKGVTVTETPKQSVAAFHTKSGEGKGEACVFCSRFGHMSERCFGLKNMSSDKIRNQITQSNLCFICLKGNHFARQCKSQQRCKTCKGPHHSLLCRKPEHSVTRNDRSPTTEETTADSNVIYAHLKSRNKSTLMQVVRTKVTHGKNTIEVDVLFDGGSDRSFISQSLAQKLKLKASDRETFAFSGFGGTGSGPRRKRNIYTVPLSGVQVDLAEIPTICADMFRSSVPEEVLNKFNASFTEDLSVGRTIHVDILIGLDFYWKLVTDDMTRVDSLVAQRTQCGWMLSGEYASRSKPTNGLQLLCVEPITDSVIRSLWELEAIGIHDEGKNPDSQVLEQFSKLVSFNDGRYCVALPWKDHMKGKLKDNFSLAEKRLKSLSKRLAPKQELKEQYDSCFQEMEESGVIKEVSMADTCSGPVFYLPHRPVVRECSKTTKVRPVFDASAKGYNGISLNDCLETGPNLLPNMLEILIRFRRWKVAVTADVTKAFLQIRVKEEDQSVLRFLWEHNKQVRVMVFDRVPFGTKSSPFLLNASIKHHLKGYGENRAITELKQNLYVDDFLSGADTEEEACSLIGGAKRVLAEAGMNLTKWSSNSCAVAGTILKEFDPKLDATENTSVLGLKWIPSEDCFSFNGLERQPDLVITKRIVLSFIARLFDPLGFYAPFTITVKILFQDLWELGVDWDIQLPEVLCNQFHKWLDEIPVLQEWRIPRCFVDSSWSSAQEAQLHIFCDASEKAYGCCAYIRLVEADSVKVSLVMAKARVAPLKRVSLPRLELLAAVLGARILQFLKTALALPPEAVYKCYTDSMITLGWIQGESKRWKAFVANRVQEIQDITNPSCWSHCPGSENPADMLTRGISANSLMKSTVWLQGPVWLSGDLLKSNLDFQPETLVAEDAVTQELRVSPCVSVQMNSVAWASQLTNWSSLPSAIRVMGWILRFVNKCLKKSAENCTQLTDSELVVASERLVQLTQQEYFTEEMNLLRKGKSISKTSTLYKLSPFLGVDGLMRAKCRLNYSDLSFDEKFPVILPKCHLAMLIVKDIHIKLKHAGVNQLICAVRNQFWIVGLRSVARKVKHECLACKRIDAKACQEPVAPIMEARLKQSPPFSVVGVDYAGPVYCKDFHGKFYILLFTCAVIRAVHLELVDSMSLPTFLLAFRRFVARRGLPTVVFSDNAKTFVSAPSELFKLFGSCCPRWRYSVPRAPWWGGWWERMVKNMKMSLKKSVGIRCLEKPELETILTEVEACVNSRPLTFVGDHFDDGHPLTPFHFLLGRNDHLTTQVCEPDINVSTDSLIQHNVVLQERINMFWKRWREEYLKQLPLPKRRDASGKVSIGSVVLIREDNCPRLQWPMGVIEELFEGRDGIVRSVRVKTNRGSFTRPIQRIHDLELNAHPEPVEIDKPNVSVTKFGRVVKVPDRYH